MLDAAANDYSVASITSRVRDLVMHAQARLVSGYTAMLVKVGGYQYSYKLWAEDSDGHDLPFEGPLPNYPHPYDCSYYGEIQRGIWPGKGTGLFELYALHLGVMSSQAVQAQNKRLAFLLSERK